MYFLYFTTSQSQLYVYCGLPVLVRVKKSRVSTTDGVFKLEAKIE